MLKYYLIVVAVLLGLLAGSGYALKRSYSRNGEIKAELTQAAEKVAALEKQAKADQALLKKRAAAEKEARARETAAHKALERSLFENREWADQPVPKEVLDALRP